MLTRIAAAALLMTSSLICTQAQHPATLLVVEKGTRSLALIDPTSGKETASVPVGGITGHEVAASPDGRFAYVPIYGDSGVGKPGTDGQTMAIIDIAARKVTATVDFGHAVRPHLPVMNANDGLLYVTTELDRAITVVDPKSQAVVGSIPTGSPESHMLVISHDGSRGYSANVGPGTVSVLDLRQRKLLSVIPVAGEVQRIAISNDDRLVFTSDQTSPRLAVIDTATGKLKQWTPLPAIGYGGAASPDGHWFFLALPDVNKVAVVDLQSMLVVRTIDVAKGPQAVVISPDGKTAYVSCQDSNQVAEIDLAGWKVARLINTGAGTDGMAWAQTR